MYRVQKDDQPVTFRTATAKVRIFFLLGNLVFEATAGHLFFELIVVFL